MTRKPTARQKILAATEELLATEGLLAINTNRVADEAQVNISTLYTNCCGVSKAHASTTSQSGMASSIRERIGIGGPGKLLNR